MKKENEEHKQEDSRPYPYVFVGLRNAIILSLPLWAIIIYVTYVLITLFH
jgi:hypothetical protein